MPRKTRFQLAPLAVPSCEAPLAQDAQVTGLLGDWFRGALDSRGLLADEQIDLIVTPELRQLRVASAELPFTQLDLAVSVARPGVADPVYMRRIEIETRQRSGETDTAERLREDPTRSSLGRAARSCVDALADALQTKFGVLTDSGLGVVR